jgi:hypothetical protein
MKTMSDMARTARRLAAVAVACAALGSGGCGLDEETIPELSGPSVTGSNVKLTATPDVITADGFSSSLVQVQVFDQNGNPAAGRSVLLAIADGAGNFADIGTLYATNGTLLRAAEAVVVTGGNGIGQAVYTAPARTDFTADAYVTIAGREVGNDANGSVYRSVKIELKSAEPRLFPINPGNALPVCGFVVEAPVGSTTCSGPTTCTVKVNTSVLFQTTSVDSDGFIVRYEWYFGDGTNNEDSPDTNHPFRSVGTFTVTHRVTDNNGGASACTATITVAP